MRFKLSGLFLVLAVLAAGPICSAAELFSHSTDTIAISGNPAGTTQVTYEATVEFNSIADSSGVSNWIYDSWEGAAEEQSLGELNGGVLNGFAYPLHFPTALETTAGSVTTNTWYDIAYVYNGSEESLYINGTLEASRASSGPLSTGTGVTSAVGAMFRDGLVNHSFQGEIESLRISDIGRYSGSEYSAVLGESDFSDDSSTLLLYDFDNAPVGGSITDLSGNGHTGTLGVGFGGATSPTFVPLPEPATFALLGLFASACCLRRRRPI